VQWHAEYDPATNPINRALFEAFGDAVHARANGGLHGRQAAE
jgi:putative glutamine amidotransferase